MIWFFLAVLGVALYVLYKAYRLSKSLGRAYIRAKKIVGCEDVRLLIKERDHR